MTVRFVIDGPASPREVRARLRGEGGILYVEMVDGCGSWRVVTAYNAKDRRIVLEPWGGVEKVGDYFYLNPSIFPAFADPDPAPEPQDAAPDKAPVHRSDADGDRTEWQDAAERPFKVGDRVLIEPIGKYGTVICLKGDCSSVRLEGAGRGTVFFRNEALEHAPDRPFKVGDRVRTDDDVSGVIVQLSKSDGVEWARVFRPDDNYADWQLISSLTHADAAPAEPAPDRPFRVGDRVRLNGHQGNLVIQRIDRGAALIGAESSAWWVHLDSLTHADAP